MKKKYSLLVLAVALIALGTLFGIKKYYASSAGSFVGELGLSSGQKQTHQAALRKLQVRQEDLCARLCREREDLMALLTTEPLVKEKISEKLKEINRLQGEIELATVNHIFEVQEILTREQKARYLARLNQKICEFNAESIGSKHHQQMRDK